MARGLPWCGALLLIALMSGCTAFQQGRNNSRFISDETYTQALLSEETLSLNASTAPFDIDQAVVLTDNDDAFASKLELIQSANETLDLAYYIFADDYSSSLLTKALVEAAQRGVRVRLLVDYHTNYKRLDWYSMMQARGDSGQGSLEVRFYNRPTKNIVKDATFLTMGCGEDGRATEEDCGPAKFDQIDQRFAQETINGQPVGDRNISNLDIGGSGLFLSGLYAKNPEVMKLAIAEGQGLDPKQLQGGPTQPEDLEHLKSLGQIYFKSRYSSGLDRAVARVQLSLVGLFYREEVDPVYDAFTAYLPVERPQDKAEARRDWRYLTDFLHHKLLLADGRAFQLGGRNVEDSYHMAPNRLTEKYVFSDTDVLVTLNEPDPALTESFDRLWDFDLMVARLDEVRTHAPNDFLVATKTAAADCQEQRDEGDAAYDACRETALVKAQERTLAQRVAGHRERMLTNARLYGTEYRPRPDTERSPQFTIDASALVNYVENLPLDQTQTTPGLVRSYGARNGMEGDYGKHIHALWLSELRNVCTVASAEEPQRVILHNAYFFPPSNIVARLGRMVDGSEDCGHVTVTVLTNSIQTTDLNVVNIAARQSLKAFTEFSSESRHPERSATFEYFEYQPLQDGEGPSLSLHSKVAVIGPHIFIGSANADVRSYMMDSNNGLLIRNAPQMVAEYTEWVDSLLADEALTREEGEYFKATTRAQMLEQDEATMRAILAKYRAERWIETDEQVESAMDSAARILNQAYGDTQESLGTGRASDEAQKRYNETFKTI